ncbi:MerR family DNA-binding protein [Idiomarina xiamenensis]|uniref:MerR family transcriptional regulator n=1 Tax=Idiomarina xiamenensis 10-D-4 TaxID=740709 RepID=K2JZC6_9GAMM|nr:MerR family DNA-binding protein [Idiomarina xiamenensis]EKE79952.1 MerR family transcriptional regulator [Idiomarina xiamenensis 10-D-4]
MRIQAVSAQTGLTDKTIRYYEDIDLLPTVPRQGNGYRNYRQEDVERLQFIKRCRELQIPLDDIANLLALKADPGHSCREVDDLVVKQLQAVEQKIAALQQLQQQLQQLSLSCRQHRVADCEVLKKLSLHDNEVKTYSAG